MKRPATDLMAKPNFDMMTRPPLALLVKLGSIMVHVEEASSVDGHEFDWVALRGLLADPEVLEWRKAMDAAGFLPKKRSDRS